jgi:hypothetical protein
MPTMTDEMTQEMIMEEAIPQMDEPMPNFPQMEPGEFIIGLIRNQCIVLEGALNEAKLRFANATLADTENKWTTKYDEKLHCKVIEGQIMILQKLERDYNAMFSD